MVLFFFLAIALILGVPVGISLGVASIGGILASDGAY